MNDSIHDELIVLKDLNRDTEYVLDEGDTIVGRGSDCAIALSDTLLSREHAKFLCDGRKVWVEDLSSTNGTQLNHTRLKTKHELKHGDILRLGDQVFQLLVPGRDPVDVPKIGRAAGSYVSSNDTSDATSLKNDFALPPGWSQADKSQFAKQFRSTKPSKAAPDKTD